MFGILFRATILDLAKVLLVTASVLVTVIAFGAAIKPLSENLLGPPDILRYMAYATVPMLQFALPFAAAFAGVVVYHRMAIDNEVVAMATSGMAYRRILLPAFAMGVALTVVMFILVDSGVPMFWQASKRLIASDLTRVFVAQVERGEAFRIRDTEIYADEAHLATAPQDTGASQRLVLVGVAAIELGPDGLPHREFAAQYATVDVHRVAGNAVLKVAFQDATIFNRGDNAIAGSHIVRPEAVDLGQAVEFGPKGLNFRELLALRHSMDTFPAIVECREHVLGSLAACDAWKAIASSFAAGEAVVFRSAASEEGAVWTLQASELEGSTATGGPGGQVTLRQYLGQKVDPAKLRSEITAPSMVLTLSEARDGVAALFDILANDAVVRDLRDGSGGAGSKGTRRPVRLAELSLGAVSASRASLPSDALIAAAATAAAEFDTGPSELARATVQAHTANLTEQLRRLRDEIVARIVQRTSQALTAFLMLSTASILSILLRHRPALLVYGLAFIPAIIDILLVSGGEQMLRREVTLWGVLVAYSGNALLLVLSLAGMWKLTRH